MPHKTPDLFQLLYVSTFARGLPVQDVPLIVAQSRLRNVARDITGILIFDGGQFCQYLEGTKAIVIELLEHISHDARHSDIKVLHSGLMAERRFSRFAMGLATLGDDEEFLERVNRLEGKEAMKSFFEGIKGLDRTADTSQP